MIAMSEELVVGALYTHKVYSAVNGTKLEYTGETVRKRDSSVSDLCDPKHEAEYKTHYAFKRIGSEGLQWLDEGEIKGLTAVK